MMKKLVALIMALCLLGSAALAEAVYALPTSLSELSAPEIPEIPEFSIKANGGVYELTVEDIESSAIRSAALEVYGTAEYDWCRLEMSWDEARKCFVSQNTMSDAAFANAFLELSWGVYGGTVSDVRVTVANGTLITASLVMWSDQHISQYRWDLANNQMQYELDDANTYDNLLDAAYSTLTGRPTAYTIYTKEGVGVSYTRFGTITGAELDTASSSYFWDIAQQCWTMGGQPVETDLLPITLENYPAPYAEEYAPKRPAATAAECDLNAGILITNTDGTMDYNDTIVTGFYDANGKLEAYAYSSMDESKYVVYMANDTLTFAMISTADNFYMYGDIDGWTQPLPEGINLDDMGPLKAQ